MSTPDDPPADNIGAPESFLRTDPDTLKRIESWIASIHPVRCVELLAPLLRGETRFWTTSLKLAAHCLSTHGQGLEFLVDVCAAIDVYQEAETGLADAIRGAGGRLGPQLEASLRQMDVRKGGAEAAWLVARFVEDDQLVHLWEVVWQPGVAESVPRIASYVVRAAALKETRSYLIVHASPDQLERIFGVVGDELVRALVYSDSLAGVREAVLDRLVEKFGVRASRSIIGVASYAPSPPRAVVRATHQLMATSPDDALMANGVGLCLALDPDFAHAVVLEWINGQGRYPSHSGLLEHLIKESDQKVFFEELANDVGARPAHSHPLIAARHARLLSVGAATGWLENNIERPETARYSSALVAAYLSAGAGATSREILQALLKHAETLHAKFGKSAKETVLRKAAITDPKLDNYDTLVAVALAENVANPPSSLDPAIALDIVRWYPFTFQALGGPSLEKAVADAEDLPCLALYADDLVHLSKDDARLLCEGKLDPEVYEWRQNLWAGTETARQRWEQRFRTIHQAGIRLQEHKSRELRQDPYAWHEIRILARLTPFFDIDPEPTGLAGMGNKRPDFLLRCPDGNVILEVATVGAKPTDVLEGVKVSSGGVSKKTLLNKWREQFGECKTDLRMPLVILLHTEWTHDIDFDVANSLYGPQQVRILLDSSRGYVYHEAPARDEEKGFFRMAGVDCVSAVAGVSGEETQSGRLRGELFRPVQGPRYPISRKLWARLRTALFGPRPSELVERMGSIPTMTAPEAQLLVDAGVDDPGFFALGDMPWDADIPVLQERYNQLLQEARRYASILQSGDISFLKAAKGVDLGPLHRKGIHFVRQLLTEECPSGFDRRLWDELAEEARLFVSR